MKLKIMRHTENPRVRGSGLIGRRPYQGSYVKKFVAKTPIILETCVEVDVAGRAVPQVPCIRRCECPAHPAVPHPAFGSDCFW